MSNFVTYNTNRGDLLGDFDRADSSQRKNEKTRAHHLLQARGEMETELQRLRSTAAVISETSTTIGSINHQYGVYQSRLVSAANALKNLKKKMKSDDSYIYWSYLIFLFTSCWIFLRRVRVIGFIQWITSKGFYGANVLLGVSEESEDTRDVQFIPTRLPMYDPLPSEIPHTSTTTFQPTHAVPLTRRPFFSSPPHSTMSVSMVTSTTYSASSEASQTSPSSISSNAHAIIVESATEDSKSKASQSKTRSDDLVEESNFTANILLSSLDVSGSPITEEIFCPVQGFHDYPSLYIPSVPDNYEIETTTQANHFDDDLPEPTGDLNDYFPAMRSHSLTTTPHAKTDTPQRPLPAPQLVFRNDR